MTNTQKFTAYAKDLAFWLERVAVFADPKSPIPDLHNICITKRVNGIYADATDRYRMISRKLEGANVDPDAEFSFTINAKVAQQVAAWAKSAQKNMPKGIHARVEVEIDTSTYEHIRVSVMDQAEEYPSAGPENFPHIKPILDAAEKAAFEEPASQAICINSKHLASIAPKGKADPRATLRTISFKKSDNAAKQILFALDDMETGIIQLIRNPEGMPGPERMLTDLKNAEKGND
ncbi:hypothetical protein [Schaalia sp. lx-100]|uniref:hypothetical protein n=1 Tax=Schaalia sp. lx-100 TaxID=2899081 RepID=UPI001E610CD8|nr:hypothetical protein [Schaalia sp. lx-100]MCD4557194.1 hypothetical protein [Schaalia sp. lx-100]